MKTLEYLLGELLDIDDIVHIQKESNNSLFISRATNPAKILNIIETETLSEDINNMKDIISEQEYLINSFIEQIKNPSESFNLEDYVEVFKTIEDLKSKI